MVPVTPCFRITVTEYPGAPEARHAAESPLAGKADVEVILNADTLIAALIDAAEELRREEAVVLLIDRTAE